MSIRILTLGLLVFSSLAGARAPHVPIEISGLTLIDGNRSLPMRDNTPRSRSRFGVPLSKQYFIFDGRKASTRTENKTPLFEFVADPATNAPANVYLFRFDVRGGRREIRVAKGSGGLAELRIPHDHLITVSVEETGEGPNNSKRYRLKPKAPLRPGEYCLAEGISSFYPFGVD